MDDPMHSTTTGHRKYNHPSDEPIRDGLNAFYEFQRQNCWIKSSPDDVTVVDNADAATTATTAAAAAAAAATTTTTTGNESVGANSWREQVRGNNTTDELLATSNVGGAPAARVTSERTRIVVSPEPQPEPQCDVNAQTMRYILLKLIELLDSPEYGLL
jgi:hypothetical protein